MLAAVVAMAAAVAVCVVAAAIALYAGVRSMSSPAAAAAAVVGAAAVLALIVAFVPLHKIMLPRKTTPPEEETFFAKALAMAKDRPIMAVGALAAVSVIAARNPKILGLLVTTLLAGSTPPRPPKR